MVLPGEPLVLYCTPMLLIGRNNKSHEVVPSICKGGSLAPQCGYNISTLPLNEKGILQQHQQQQ